MKARKIIITMLVLLISVTLIAGCSLTNPSDKGSQGPVSQPDPGSEDQQTPKSKENYISEIDLYKAGLGIDSVDEGMFVSPKEKKAVFVGTRLMDNKGQPLSEPEAQLVIVDLLTGELKSLDKGQFARVLEWSPDGQHILYLSDFNDLKVVNIRTGKTTKLASQAYSGSFSPDSSKVAYTKLNEGIYVAGIEGSDKKQVTSKKGDWFPMWYPDGSSLFFFGDRDKALGDGAGQLEGLARLDLQTGKRENLLPEETGKYRRATWIVPGKSLYIEKGWDDGFYEIMVNLETGKVTDFGESPMGIMRSSVDQTEGLLYVTDGNTVRVMDAGGQVANSFELEKPVDSKQLTHYGLKVSPKGDKIAYLFGEVGVSSTQPEVQGRKVWVADSNGTNAREVVKKYSYFRPPSWTTEGDGLIVIEDSGSPAKGEGELFLKILPIE